MVGRLRLFSVYPYSKQELRNGCRNPREDPPRIHDLQTMWGAPTTLAGHAVIFGPGRRAASRPFTQARVRETLKA
jgi:hypothetical protein